MIVTTMIVVRFDSRSGGPFGRQAATVRAAPIYGNRRVLDLKAVNKFPLDGLYDCARIRSFGQTDVHRRKGSLGGDRPYVDVAERYNARHSILDMVLDLFRRDAIGSTFQQNVQRLA